MSHAVNAVETGQYNGDKQPPSIEGQGRPINRAVTPGGNPLDQSQPAFPTYHRKFGNPAPLGLCAFALTTFVLSMINVHTRGNTTPNIVVGLAFGYGGLVQLLAGMWEFAAGNTFGATAFSSYGGFWISYACIYVDFFGIVAAYENPSDLDTAVGLYLIAWAIFTFLMFLATFKSSLSLMSVFFFLTITFALLSAGAFSASTSTTIAGGAFGIVTAFCAWYTALTGLLTPTTAYFVIPSGNLARE